MRCRPASLWHALWLRKQARSGRWSRRGGPVQLCFEPLENRLALTILTVNSLADGPVNLTDATVTLRDAIEAANNDVAVSPGGPSGSGADEIRFQSGLSGTIALNQGLGGTLTITSDLTITGPGASVVSVSGDGATRVFSVNNGTVSVKTVTISGLTISGGGGFASGGGILNAENLNVVSSTLIGNSAEKGSGIFNSGTLTVQNSTISGNSATNGAGIFNSGTVSVQNSTISGNPAGDIGGGIYNSGTLTVQNSTINANSAAPAGGGVGGGLWNDNAGTLIVRNSAISGNSAGNNGGGIGSLGMLTVQNSTISNNSTNGIGGGIRNDGTLTLQNSTITQNHANNDNFSTATGGGIASGTSMAAFTLHNTIVADNFTGSGTTTESDIENIFSPVDASSSNNLIGTGGSGGLTNGTNGNLVGVADPKLGPLADNGGPTKTHALLGGSRAVNAGNNAQVPTFSSFDQRGDPFPRIVSGTVDIGAYEAPPPITVVVDTDMDEADGNEGPGHLSLREAINRTNASAGADTITFSTSFFSTPRLIVLGLGHLAVTDDLTITGPGANLLTVNGDLASRVFTVDDLDTSVKTVTISGLTIAQGNAGGILNRENLTVSSSTIRDNTSTTGGGGIRNFGTLMVKNCTISGNVAQADSGGIASIGGVVTVQNSTISGNKANTVGGGITATGTLTVRNSTITQNRANNDNIGTGLGGGIRFADATVTLHNSIVADNFTGSGTSTEDDISAVNGPVNSISANNLIGAGGSSGLSNGVNGNQVGVADPKLGPLAINGGRTLTHALLTGSPAIDMGSNAQTPASLTTDQRGLARIFNTIVDIGSFELQPVNPWYNADIPLDVSKDGSRTSIDALIIFNRLNSVGPGAVPGDAQLGIPFFYDPSNDNFVTSIDALLIINYLNAGGAPEGEGESQLTTALPLLNPSPSTPSSYEPSLPAAPSTQDELSNIIALLSLEAAEQAQRRRRGP